MGSPICFYLPLALADLDLASFLSRWVSSESVSVCLSLPLWRTYFACSTMYSYCTRVRVRAGRDGDLFVRAPSTPAVSQTVRTYYCVRSVSVQASLDLVSQSVWLALHGETTQRSEMARPLIRST